MGTRSENCWKSTTELLRTTALTRLDSTQLPMVADERLDRTEDNF